MTRYDDRLKIEKLMPRLGFSFFLIVLISFLRFCCVLGFLETYDGHGFVMKLIYSCIFIQKAFLADHSDHLDPRATIFH